MKNRKRFHEKEHYHERVYRAPHQWQKVSVPDGIGSVGTSHAYPTYPCQMAEIPKGKGECSMLGSKAT